MKNSRERSSCHLPTSGTTMGSVAAGENGGTYRAQSGPFSLPYVALRLPAVPAGAPFGNALLESAQLCSGPE